MSDEKRIKLYGRIFIQGEIEAQTGLHIGGTETAVSIGGVDNTVIRDPLTGRPYIPGSSLKGKMRSLTEKFDGLPQNQRIGSDVYIHVAQNKDEYRESDVSHIYGIPANDFSLPTRLAVRDVPLSDQSAEALNAARTDLPYTEVKTEVAVDRVTAAATPRQLERVPAGAVFGPLEMIFSLFDPGDGDRFLRVLDGLQYVEDDYLGGSGTRGSGKVVFTNLKLLLKTKDQYHEPEVVAEGADLAALVAQRETIQKKLQAVLPEKAD